MIVDHFLLAWLRRRISPGLGYGLCWNNGPDAVVSAPVLASLPLSNPVDHEPLKNKHTVYNNLKYCVSKILP